MTIQTCYLLHHGVLRSANSSTKLRVVFNDSANIGSGESLNECLLPGSNLLSADVLLRWRRHKYVLAIEKMYRSIPRIGIYSEFWRYNPTKDYRLNTVTYGLTCASFLATRTLRQLADDKEARHRLGASVFRRDVYVDDVLTSASTLPEAKETTAAVTDLLGGFLLKK